MKKLILLLAMAFVSAFVVVSQMACMTIPKKKHPLHLQLKTINNTNSDGVSRLELDIIGVSYTSSRIDSAKIFTSDGSVYLASDIDGVDFHRYFQWEDNGIIPVEIDFPRNENYNKTDTLVVYTVYGEYRTTLNGK